jgi:hypothetical protein
MKMGSVWLRFPLTEAGTEYRGSSESKRAGAEELHLASVRRGFEERRAKPNLRNPFQINRTTIN